MAVPSGPPSSPGGRAALMVDEERKLLAQCYQRLSIEYDRISKLLNGGLRPGSYDGDD